MLAPQVRSSELMLPSHTAHSRAANMANRLATSQPADCEEQPVKGPGTGRSGSGEQLWWTLTCCSISSSDHRRSEPLLVGEGNGSCSGRERENHKPLGNSTETVVTMETHGDACF